MAASEEVSVTMTSVEVEGTPVQQPTDQTTTKKRRKRTTTTATAATTTTTKKKVTKRARQPVLGFYLAYGDSGRCVGVICADSDERAREICATEHGLESFIPIPLEQEYFYGVSLGEPESVPVGVAAATSTAGDNKLYCISEFDFVPGIPGLGFAVAATPERARELADAYLIERSLRPYSEAEYSVAPLQLIEGWYAF
jgi:hypothetical protein